MNSSKRTHWVQGIGFAQAFILISMPRAGTKTLLALTVQNGDIKKLTTLTLHKSETLTNLHYRFFFSFQLIQFSRERLEASHL
jgi:hypothetical protein